MGEEVEIASLSYKLIHEKSDPVKAAIVYSTLADEDMTGAILAGQLAGMDKKARSMVRYAENPDKYTAGLPTVDIGYVEDFFYTPLPVDFTDKTPYPVVNIRRNQVFVGEAPNGEPLPRDPLYLETKGVMKKAGIPLKSIISGLKGGGEEEKPDLNDLDDTFFLYASDIYSPLEATAEYLFRFFSWLEEEFVIGPPVAPDPDDPDPPVEVNQNYVRWIEYINTENEFNCEIRCDYIDRSESTNTTLVDERGKPVAYQKEVIPSMPEDPLDPAGPASPDIVRLKRQVSVGVVEVLMVVRPIHSVFIDAKGENKFVSTGIKEEFIGLNPDSLDPEEAGKAGTGAFYVPMFHEIVKELRSNKSEQIALYDGATLALFAATTTQLKWYQTFVFRIIMTIATIVITAFFAPAGIGLNSLLQASAVVLVGNLVLNMVLEFLLKKGVIGKIAAAAIIVYMAYRGYIKGGSTSMPMASQLLHTVKAISKLVVLDKQGELIDMQKEMEDFTKSYKERQEEINEAVDGLSVGGLDPSLLIAATTGSLDPNETPNDFFGRTLTTDGGIAEAKDAPNIFLKQALLLPENRPTNRNIEALGAPNTFSDVALA